MIVVKQEDAEFIRANVQSGMRLEFGDSSTRRSAEMHAERCTRRGRRRAGVVA